MSQRDDLFKKFGPKLIEAFISIVLDEINILRVEASLTPRTPAQVFPAVLSKLNSCSDYEWMLE